MSHRIAQVESTLKRVLAQALSQRVSDPRIEGMVSITRVTVSPDLHDAYVYVSILPQKFEKRTIRGLQHASGYIHTLVREAMALNTVPRLEFRLDDTLKKQAAVDAALHRGATRLPADTPPGSTPVPDQSEAGSASPSEDPRLQEPKT